MFNNNAAPLYVFGLCVIVLFPILPYAQLSKGEYAGIFQIGH